MIKFIIEEDQVSSPVFGDVETDQFFVHRFGWLCQKHGPNSFNVLADFDGIPDASRETHVFPDMPITRILPRVTKIEWGE
jgi:hypothetical protein